MGFGLPDENLHAQNVQLNLENFDKGDFSDLFVFRIDMNL
jgi:hypothetical protein